MKLKTIVSLIAVAALAALAAGPAFAGEDFSLTSPPPEIEAPQADGFAAISLFGAYTIPNSGADYSAWGAGIEASADLGPVIATVSYVGAWGEGDRPDRHRATVGARKGLLGGENSLWSLYVDGGAGIERVGSDTDTLLFGGIGAELFLTDSITLFTQADYYFNFDRSDYTGISAGLRYHF